MQASTATVIGAPATPRPRAVLAVMCAGMFLVLLDVTVVNVAVPAIGAGLHAGLPELQWTVDAYAVAIAGLLLAGGSLGDRIGHRRVLLCGFALFGLASVGCASAPSPAALIAARAVQGVGGALLLPSTMAVIADVFPERAAQSRALGIWAAISSLALPAGPLLGGVLVGQASWRLVFWINVPLVLMTVVAAARVVPPAGRRAAGRLDVGGLVALVLTLTGTVFTIIEAGRGAPVGLVVVAAVGTLGAAVAAYRFECSAPHPVLPLDLLRRPAFVSPNAVALTMSLTFNGLLFVIMLYLQDVLHRAPLRAGLYVLPLAVPLVLLAPVSGRLTARRGPRTAVALGCLVAAPGAGLLVGVRPDGATGWLVAGFGLLGCGAGLVTASVVAAAVQASPPERSGLATGVSNTARQIGTATGVAPFGAVAGPTVRVDAFVRHLHVLAILAALLWALAFVAAITGMRPADPGGSRRAGGGSADGVRCWREMLRPARLRRRRLFS
jgi:DHA2 family methylenomycin A resistance protein-like MFS transporter